MKLQSLRVEQLRQFRQPVEIRDLQPGINLFTGPNESGKSTLVRAIRAVFFERFRSSSVDDLQPWGDSSAAPSIELEFDWQGERWHLIKSFLRHKRCDLRVGARALNGEEAEEQLSSLLGYQFPSRGASKAEHWGIPGLLWIEQGAGQELGDAVSYAGDHLQSALGESLGEVASSAGDELIAEVERERTKLRTAGTGRATGELARATHQVEVLEAQRAELGDKITTYQQQVDRLGILLREQQQDQVKPWEVFRQQAVEAQRQLDEVEGWVREQEREQKESLHCEQSQQLCRDQLQSFARQQEELEKRRKVFESAKAALQGLEAQQAPLESRLSQARATYQLARECLAHARQQEQRNVLVEELARLKQQLAEAADNQSQARALQTQLSQLREQLQLNAVDAAPLKRLRQLSGELDKLLVTQQAVATRLRYDLLPGQSLQVDGQAVSGQAEVLLLAPTVVEIQGVGKLHISPGGEDLADLALRQQTLQDDLASLLSSLRVASLAQAEQRAEQCQLLAEEIKRTELQLGHFAPQGLEALIEAQQLSQLRQKELLEQLQQIAEGPGELPSVAQAEHEQQVAMETLSEAEAALAEYRTSLALGSQRLQSATEEWQRLSDDLNAPDRQQREKQLRDQLIDLQAESQRLQLSLTARQQQIDCANPQILSQDVTRLNNSAQALEEAARNRGTDIARLQSSLEALGAQGLEEQRAETEQELDAAVRRRDELIRRADALELLLELLKARRHALTQRLQAPLQRHLNRYLQLLFPQARLTVDEHLLPTQLVRTVNGSAEYGDFAALSFGAREQMGLISRLAYADLLQEAGRPTLIILDDALVHSDQQRLAQMKRVLFDAAQRHQILLFTCHPENWRDLGVVPRDIQALKTAG